MDDCFLSLLPRSRLYWSCTGRNQSSVKSGVLPKTTPLERLDRPRGLVWALPGGHSGLCIPVTFLVGLLRLRGHPPRAWLGEALLNDCEKEGEDGHHKHEDTVISLSEPDTEVSRRRRSQQKQYRASRTSWCSPWEIIAKKRDVHGLLNLFWLNMQELWTLAINNWCPKNDLSTRNLSTFFTFCFPKNNETMIYNYSTTFFPPTKVPSFFFLTHKMKTNIVIPFILFSKHLTILLAPLWLNFTTVPLNFGDYNGT